MPMPDAPPADITARGEAIAAAARALLGVRFRPQGRDPARGLDCAGLVLRALAGAGRPAAAPRDYPPRGGSADMVAALMATAGLVAIEPGEARAGDVLLVGAGAAQLHLVIRTSGGVVHADAGLRRVVERPGMPAWPILGAWRS